MLMEILEKTSKLRSGITGVPFGRRELSSRQGYLIGHFPHLLAGTVSGLVVFKDLYRKSGKHLKNIGKARKPTIYTPVTETPGIQTGISLPGTRLSNHAGKTLENPGKTRKILDKFPCPNPRTRKSDRFGSGRFVVGSVLVPLVPVLFVFRRCPE